jgi:hypothetical protein
VSEAAAPSGSPGSDDGTPGTQVGVVPAAADEVLVEFDVEPAEFDVELVEFDGELLPHAARAAPRTTVMPSAPAVRRGRIRIYESLPGAPIVIRANRSREFRRFF